MAEYPAYVNAYNGIPLLFEKIKSASVPPKFTVDFLSTVLDMKSSSYRALIHYSRNWDLSTPPMYQHKLTRTSAKTPCQAA